MRMSRGSLTNKSLYVALLNPLIVNAKNERYISKNSYMYIIEMRKFKITRDYQFTNFLNINIILHIFEKYTIIVFIF